MAFRLIFESDQGEIRLARRSRVEMLAPEQPAGMDQRGPGVFAEVRNDREETLYRANISSQLDPTVEVFAPDGSMQRVDAPGQTRVFVVITPDPPEARSLVVVRRGGEPQAGDERVQTEAVTTEQELARVDLTGGLSE